MSTRFESRLLDANRYFRDNVFINFAFQSSEKRDIADDFFR